ncbi:MAG: hypothetical protein WC234_06290 [Endomicrobiaceae bacterium]|jgi:GNAT superfamily N-acetyltransferase|nr:GNAT family N-acetyltransferase [Candidatus Cloacimonadota bacterium]
MDFKIVNVKDNKQLLEFVKFPFHLYNDNNLWVPPLVSDQLALFNKKNPFFEHSKAQLFYVTKGNKIVGRISAHTNKMHNNFHQDKKGFFGFFETINNIEVATLLLDNAIKWLKEQGCDVVSGPYNFTTNDECGLLVEGFETSPFVMMPHNFEYYQELMEKYGLTKAMDLYAWLLESDTMPPFLDAVGKRLNKSNQFTVRCLNKNNLKKDIETVFEIYQKAWEMNWGFVPMTETEFNHLVKTLLPIVNPNLVFIAESEGKPAGFSVALPDYNVLLKKLNGKKSILGIIKYLYFKNKVNSLRVITMGVVKEYQGKGIDSLFYYHTWKNGMKLGFNRGEFSWVLETNSMMNKIAKHLGAHIHKVYRIYEKEI